MFRRMLLPLVTLLLSAPPVHAQWRFDGTLITAAAYHQLSPAIVADNAGGAIVAWQDFRNGSTYNIYAQRVSASGVPQWTANGVVVSNASSQDQVVISTDGSGGAIIAWRDSRGASTDIYAQRVNASGAPQWTANGVSVCSATGNQQTPVIVSDGAGGAIVSWRDPRAGGGASDIYAQRVSGAGVVQWTVDGVVICNASGTQLAPALASDGAAGAIVTWEDSRSGNADIYAQRVSSTGVSQWTANGVALCVVANNQRTPMITSDGFGGAVVTWWDMRAAPTNGDIYAQRVNSAGVVQWVANGVAVCTAADNQLSPALVSDGAGGAVIVWQDFRNATAYDVFAQRLDAAGVARFTTNGVAVTSASSDQSVPFAIPDGSGGAIVTWLDQRSGNLDLYAQRVTGQGAMLWTVDGAPLCQATGTQDYEAIASDGAGGAIVAWEDDRADSYHLYAQHLEGNYGYWGRPEPTLVSAKDVPKDQGGRVALDWSASARDIAVPATIDHYSVWRAVDTAPGGGYYWELIGTQPATRFATYSFSVPTRADSVLNNQANEFFMVTAHPQANNQIAFASNVLSGHSVDNLSPDTPPFLVATRDAGRVLLRWNRSHAPDVHKYAVYRAVGAHVVTSAVDFLADATDTVLVDTGAPSGRIDYAVVAIDAHGNRSQLSNDAAVAPQSGAGDTPALSVLELEPNRPNPFSSSTEWNVGLPRASAMQIEVFDVAGHRVREQVLAHQPAGWQRVVFDGRNDAGAPLPSGVYFYRVTAGAATITRKLVIAR